MNAKCKKLLDCLERNPHAVGAEKITGTNSIQDQAMTNSSPWSAAVCNTFHSLIYTLVGSHRPDVHEMDHAGVLDSKLNGYLCCSALWSLLMTSRWSSSIFKSLSLSLSMREAGVMRFLSLALMKYHLADWREQRSRRILVRKSAGHLDLYVSICGEMLRIPLENLDDLKCVVNRSHINQTHFSQCIIKLTI